MQTKQERLADDLLEGAGAIADYLLGDKKKTRRVYWLVEKQALPVFRLGLMICGRKSTFNEWITEQERRAVAQA